MPVRILHFAVLVLFTQAFIYSMRLHDNQDQSLRGRLQNYFRKEYENNKLIRTYDNIQKHTAIAIARLYTNRAEHKSPIMLSDLYKKLKMFNYKPYMGKMKGNIRVSLFTQTMNYLFGR